MKKSLSIALIAIVVLCASALAGEREPVNVKANATDGNWLQYRGDRRLSGYCNIKGNIVSTPAVLWKHFVGGREHLLTAKLGDDSTISLPQKDLPMPCSDDEFQFNWTEPEAFYDLDETGEYTIISNLREDYANKPISSQFKIGKFIDGLSGLQKAEWRWGTVDDGSGARLFRRKDGKWEEVWYTPFDAFDAVNSEVIVGDFDGDGKLEVAGMVWYEILVLDLETGEIQDRVRFYNEGSQTGRGYGWFGGFDCNGDGKKELIQLADTESHLDVFGWNEQGRLYKLWGRSIEPGITRKKTIVEPGANPVANVMANDNLEIVFSLYGYDYATGTVGDDAWHVYVIDPFTGKLLKDFKNQYLAGICDIDGDGLPEIFTTELAERVAPEKSKLRIYKWDETAKDFSVLWQTKSGENASFVRYFFGNYPLNVVNTAPPFNVTLLAKNLSSGSKPVFFTRSPVNSRDNTFEVRAWQYDQRKIKTIASVQGSDIDVLTSRNGDKYNGDSILLRCRVPGKKTTKVQAEGMLLSAFSSSSISPPSGTVTIAQEKSENSSLVVAPAACNQIVAFQPMSAGKTETLWTLQGRGTGKDTSRSGDKCVPMAEVKGDGSLAMIYCTKTDNGYARLTAVEANGNEIWHHDFEGIPWIEPTWTDAGVIYWQAGYFTSKKHQDVVVQIRAGSLYIDFQTFLIDGRDGSIIWHQTGGGVVSAYRKRWQCGGYWYTIFDWDGDGLEDLFNTWFGTFFCLGGTNGILIYNYDPTYLFGIWTPYGAGWAGNFLNNGMIQLLYAVSKGDMILMERNWVTGYSAKDILWVNLKWQKKYPKSVSSTLPALGDFDGNGRIEVIFSAENGLASYDLVSGQQLWQLAGIFGELVSCDINSDGLDECIISNKNRVYCVGYDNRENTGKTIWQYSLPAGLGAPAISKINGKTQIIVICDDGYVYSIGNPTNQ